MERDLRALQWNIRARRMLGHKNTAPPRAALGSGTKRRAHVGSAMAQDLRDHGH
jgi:hypothetical protein